MNRDTKICLYCQTPLPGDLAKDQDDCTHCGMPLGDKHPHSRKSKLSFFVKAFWGIVLFCVVMMIYLPR